jgi:hypothetical protein
VKALVTNCTRNSGLVVMRALARQGWTVYGADDRVPPLGLRANCARGPYALLPDERSPSFAAALLALLRESSPDALIPTRGIEAACRNAEAVGALTATLLPPLAAFETLNDKALLLDLCDRHGFGTPKRFDADGARAYLRANAGGGVVIKPRLDVGGGEDVWFVRDAADVDVVRERVGRRPGGALITELIPGGTECVHALHLLFDASSRLVAHFALRKTRLWPLHRGVAVGAVSVHMPELLRALLPLFEELGWRGPADVEVKIDARDGVPRMLEINPRFSGAIGFPIGCGIDMGGLYCRAALGEWLPAQAEDAYPAGVHYVDGTRWLQAVAAQWREPGNLRCALRELRDPRVPGPYQLADPGAWLGKAMLGWRRRADAADA